MKKLIRLFLLIFLLGCSKDDDACVCGSGTFSSPIDASNSIEGELFLPDGSGPFPLIIIVPGSGNEPKEDLLPFVDLFKSIGYASFIYDKRGIGGSIGTYPEEDIADPTDFLAARADDVLAILKTMENHENIDKDRIGLFASSQGSWVSTIVFDKYSEIFFMAFASGGVVPTGMEYFYDTTMLNNPHLSTVEGNALLDEYVGSLGYDSRQLLSEMGFPVLFILGGQDRSHPTLWEVDFIEELDRSNIEIQFHPDANHSLVDITTGTMNETLVPQMLQWLSGIQ